MQSDEVPKRVAEFLHGNVESYEELEILLLLHRERTQSWSAEALGARLRLSVPLTDAALSALAARRLINAASNPPGSSYTAVSANPALDETIGCLANFYASRPIEIIKLMSANAIERVRTAALRTFVEAFVLRKDKD